MSKDFFARKKTVGISIPDPKDFDMTNDDDILSCGLEEKSFSDRNMLMFNQDEGFEVKQGDNPVASLTKRLEDHFSKREIAFLLSKEMLTRMVQEMKEIKKRTLKSKEEDGE